MVSTSINRLFQYGVGMPKRVHETNLEMIAVDSIYCQISYLRFADTGNLGNRAKFRTHITTDRLDLGDRLPVQTHSIRRRRLE